MGLEPLKYFQYPAPTSGQASKDCGSRQTLLSGFPKSAAIRSSPLFQPATPRVRHVLFGVMSPLVATKTGAPYCREMHATNESTPRMKKEEGDRCKLRHHRLSSIKATTRTSFEPSTGEQAPRPSRPDFRANAKSPCPTFAARERSREQVGSTYVARLPHGDAAPEPFDDSMMLRNEGSSSTKANRLKAMSRLRPKSPLIFPDTPG